jgi:hypothetical protein
VLARPPSRHSPTAHPWLACARPTVLARALPARGRQSLVGRGALVLTGMVYRCLKSNRD